MSKKKKQVIRWINVYPWHANLRASYAIEFWRTRQEAKENGLVSAVQRRVVLP